MVAINDEPWFVMKDVMTVLGLGGYPSAYTQRLQANEEVKVLSRKTEESFLSLTNNLLDKMANSVTLISESGLYKIVLRSNKPEAKQFQNWVTQDVLPAIRKDGMYVQGEEGIAKGEMTIQAALQTSGRGGDLVSYMEPQVFLKDGQVFANSRDVAEYFGKQHFNVMRDINELHMSDDFRDFNFEACKYQVPNNYRWYDSYDMTKKGFTRLVLSFTGKKAGEFIEAYIDRFEEMEEYIRYNMLDAQQPAPIALPQTYGDALRALADKHERNLLLEQDIQEVTQVKNQLHEQVVELEGEIEEARDSVSFVEQFRNCTGTMNISEFGKILGLGRTAYRLRQ